MTDRLADVRSHLPAGKQAFRSSDDASMRWLELSMALAAIAAVVLLAVIR
jgi:hypothetical protein